MKQLLLVAITFLMNVFMVSGQIIDESFTDPILVRPAKINCIKLLTDHKILLGGDIAFYKEERVNNLIRLNADNTLDRTFSFQGNKSLIIRKIELLSTGDIIVLANLESSMDVITDKCSLFMLSPNGEIKKSIDNLLNCNSLAIQSDDKILISCGSYSRPSSNHKLLRFNSDLTSDTDFNNKVSFNDLVSDVKVFNNKIYVCGSFTSVNDTIKNNIVRLKINGSIDNSFDVGSGSSDAIYSLTIQPDGKILLGRTYINTFNGSAFHGMIRLGANGSIDRDFIPPYLLSPTSDISIIGNSIFVVASMSGTGFYLYKLNTDGLLSSDFNPVKLDEYAFDGFCMNYSENEIIFNKSVTTGSKYGLSACDYQGQLKNTFAPELCRFGVISAGDLFNGKMLISGDFMKVNNVNTYGIAMLDKNGVADKNFVLSRNLGSVKQVHILNDSTVFINTFDSFLKLNAKGTILKDFDFKKNTKLYEILRFKVLKDGNIIAADANGICRIKSDGMQDMTFDTGTGIGNSCTGLDFDMQGDKIIYGSDFESFNGTNVNKLIRLNTNGSLDPSFSIGSGANKMVLLTKVLRSGETIAGGWFTQFNGKNVSHGIVKLSKDGKLDSTFLSNQNRASFFCPIMPFETKVEQIDSIIYVKNKSSIIAINLDGTVNSQFVVPVTISTVNDIITLNDSASSSGKRKSFTDPKVNSYLYALGSFNKSTNSDPTFIMKLSLDSKQSLQILTVSSGTLNINAASNSTSTFNITSNINWNVTSDQYWLSISAGSGSNNSTITVTASANATNSPRTAIVTISGPGVPPRTITVVQDAALTAVPELSNANIKLWPVPVKEKLYISLSGITGTKYLKVYSSYGLQVFSCQVESDNAEIDMSNLAAGLYFIRIYGLNEAMITRRIIKQ
jgi:uncharacterized delta-60 repeat protein